MKLISALLAALLVTSGHGRLLLQESRDASTSQAIPPATNTSLAVPILTFQLGGPSLAPSPSPSSIGSQIAQLTEALAPSLAPVAIIAQEAVTGRKLQQARAISPAPAPAPVACSSITDLLPSAFASLGQTLGLTSTLSALPSTNYTLVVPSDMALSGATSSLAALTADPTALNQVVSQGLILGKDLTLQNGEVLTTRLADSPITVAVDDQGVTTLKTSSSSARVNMIEKSCTVDLLIVDAILLPTGLASNSLG